MKVLTPRNYGLYTPKHEGNLGSHCRRLLSLASVVRPLDPSCVEADTTRRETRFGGTFFFGGFPGGVILGWSWTVKCEEFEWNWRHPDPDMRKKIFVFTKLYTIETLKLLLLWIISQVLGRGPQFCGTPYLLRCITKWIFMPHPSCTGCTGCLILICSELQ